MVWRLPSHPSETARCASTEDHQAPSPPLFGEQEDGQAALPLYLSSCLSDTNIPWIVLQESFCLLTLQSVSIERQYRLLIILKN
jgi:hypothetical protein